MKKDPRFLYVLHDPAVDMYKIGSSRDPYKRMLGVSKALGYRVDLELATPGHDYFLKRYHLPKAPHPIPHGGRGEWYMATEETVDFIVDVWLHPWIATRPMGYSPL